ncbi:hypothetical protein PMAYCL1PPCAC_01067, partial [Pristionchus mayeri]
CDIYPFKYQYRMQEWLTNLQHHNSAALFRPDAFGLHDYNVDYSLNKKKRWALPDEIGARIEELQDPFWKLRVSAAVRCEDRAAGELGCLQYDSVSRDGA